MDTRERILRAATDVFVDKGLAGARMQEIADRADVNKAMLHYYFRTKDRLYDTVVGETIGKGFAQAVDLLRREELSLEERVKSFIDTYVDLLAAHPHLPRLILQDLATGGTRMARIIVMAQERASFLRAEPALQMIRDGIESGDIRELDPVQTMISLMGMCVFFFIARPIIPAAFGLDGREGSETFLAERKENIREVFLHGVMAQDTLSQRSTE